MQQSKAGFDEVDAVVAAVSFETMSRTEKYAEESNWPWPLLVDRRRNAYQGFSMTRGSGWKILGPQLWWSYLKILVKHRMRVPTMHDDAFQLGGDVLIDRQGVVHTIYASETPVDRPTASELIDLLGSL